MFKLWRWVILEWWLVAMSSALTVSQIMHCQTDNAIFSGAVAMLLTGFATHMTVAAFEMRRLMRGA